MYIKILIIISYFRSGQLTSAILSIVFNLFNSKMNMSIIVKMEIQSRPTARVTRFNMWSIFNFAPPTLAPLALEVLSMSSI